MPPYAPINISSFCYTNFISQYGAFAPKGPISLRRVQRTLTPLASALQIQLSGATLSHGGLASITSSALRSQRAMRSRSYVPRRRPCARLQLIAPWTSQIVIFFTLAFPKSASGNAATEFCLVLTLAYLMSPDGTIGLNSIQSWIGNTIYNDTADALGTPYKLLAPGEKFGASSVSAASRSSALRWQRRLTIAAIRMRLATVVVIFRNCLLADLFSRICSPSSAPCTLYRCNQRTALHVYSNLDRRRDACERDQRRRDRGMAVGLYLGVEA